MNMFKIKKYVLTTLIFVVLAWIVIAISGVFQNSELANPELIEVEPAVIDGYYSSYLSLHQNEIIDDGSSYQIIPTEFILEPDEQISYDNSYYDWQDAQTVGFDVTVDTEGLYFIHLEYLSTTSTHMPIVLSVQLNGEDNPPYYEASQITFDTFWSEESGDLGTDRYGNDVSVSQELYDQWQNESLKDARRLYDEGLTFYLNLGLNTIEIEKISGTIKLKEISVNSKPIVPTYEEYLSLHAQTSQSYFERIEAEEALYKNSSTIGRGINRDALVLPFSMTKLKLNVIGVDSYDLSGDAVTWAAQIDQPGYYQIAFKVLQNTMNTTVYRTLLINGEIPYEEARFLAFSYDKNWQNISLHSLEGRPLEIYLRPGDEITLQVNSSMFKEIADRLKVTMNEMSQLGLDVTKLTRNNTDKGIDWNMISYFPQLNNQLTAWINELTYLDDMIQTIYGFNRNSQIVQDILAAIGKIEKIAESINELPRRLTLLSTGSSSAVQLIANQIDSIIDQPMIMDALYVYTPDHELPNANGNLWDGIKIGVSRFFLSFFNSSYSENAQGDELEIWVNRSRQYVDLLQKITDDQFTTASGIKVKISLMSDDGKLLLANSADQQPDAALGISAWIPNEYGMRGMLYDMTQFSDFKDVISVFNPEQLIPMVYDGKLYGLPETENFFVLFYRKDILDQLDLEVPNTWDDVLDMLPVLRRYGMSFYVPLSNNSALKAFDSTAPFIYQFDGSVYHSDGLSSALDDENTIEAITFMTDLYREYSMPFQVPSFFNSFRYSTIPIGIGDFGMYLQLMNAASDISGLWDIALVPGIAHDEVNSDTLEITQVINRSMGGAQQAGIIFEKSEKKEEAWAFLSWWMSTQTQVLFSETLLNTLGTRYLWNTANLEAFKLFSWSEKDKEVILEQWTHLKENPKIPGSYIIEREISNTWNSVVYDDANLRSTISDAIIKINKELARKMKEFGYLDDKGNIIRPFIIPTTEQIRKWYEDE